MTIELLEKTWSKSRKSYHSADRTVYANPITGSRSRLRLFVHGYLILTGTITEIRTFLKDKTTDEIVESYLHDIRREYTTDGIITPTEQEIDAMMVQLHHHAFALRHLAGDQSRPGPDEAAVRQAEQVMRAFHERCLPLMLSAFDTQLGALLAQPGDEPGDNTY